MKQRPLFLFAAVLIILGAILFGLGAGSGKVPGSEEGYPDRDYTKPLLQKVCEYAGAIFLFIGALFMTNSNNRTIALNTFREALRNKVLYIILVFAIVLLGFAVVLGSISIGENDRVIKHIGLTAINVFGIFLAMFVGVNLVYDEMERRTIYTIIAHGVPRQDFIIGKFLGLLLTIVFNFVLMAIILSVVLFVVPDCHMSGLVLYSVFMSMFEMMVVIAFAILFSSFSTPVVSAVLTLAVYVIGHLSDDLLDYYKILGHEAYAFHTNVMRPVLKGIYYILPHLEEFNYKSQVTDPDLWNHLTFFPIGYGILYTVVILALSCLIFSKKDFK